MDEKPSFRPYLIPAIVMAAVGWLGLIFLFSFSLPTLWPRWLLFAFLILALTGIGFMFIEMAGIYKYQLYLHHPTLAMVVVLSSMILGAGLGSLHSGRIAEDRKERRIAPYSGGAVLVCISLFVIVPLWGHLFLLWLPMAALIRRWSSS